MMESMGRYLTSVAAAAIICGVIEKLHPKSGTASAILKMMCGIFMAVTIVSPWLKLKIYDFADYAQSFSQQADEAREWGYEVAGEYRRAIITEKVSTYILDKAAQLDLAIDVEVILTTDEQSIPCSVKIIGEVPEKKRIQLEHILETELGSGGRIKFGPGKSETSRRGFYYKI